MEQLFHLDEQVVYLCLHTSFNPVWLVTLSAVHSELTHYYPGQNERVAGGCSTWLMVNPALFSDLIEGEKGEYERIKSLPDFYPI